MSERTSVRDNYRLFSVLFGNHNLKRDSSKDTPYKRVPRSVIPAKRDSSGSIELHNAITELLTRKSNLGKPRSIRVAIADLDRWEKLEKIFGSTPDLPSEKCVYTPSTVPVIYAKRPQLLVAEMRDGSEIPGEFIDRIGNFLVKFAEGAESRDIVVDFSEDSAESIASSSPSQDNI